MPNERLRALLLFLCCCFVAPCRPTPTVTWQKKGGRLKKTSGQMSAHRHHLHFRSVQLTDDGEYECQASNSHGNISHVFTVTVEGQWSSRVQPQADHRRCSSDCACVLSTAAPYWVKVPASQLYSPGETVRLECVANGIPAPIITWSINGAVISGSLQWRASTTRSSYGGK